MAEKKTRAPGGGRKALDPEEAQSVKVMVRIRPALRDQLLDLAKRHRKDGRPNLSVEIKLALRHWVDRHEIPDIHNSALATAISVLADRCETISGKSWIDDAMTRQLLRDRALNLVRHVLAPLSSKRVAIPKEVKEEADLVLKLLRRDFGTTGTVIIDDQGLATILQDLSRHLGKGRVNVETRPELVARRKQEPEAWAQAMRVGTVEALESYLGRFGLLEFGSVAQARAHVSEARERLKALKKEA
jgi:hypothetical protein